MRNGLLGRRDVKHTGEMPPPCKRPVKPGCERRSCRMPLKAGRRTQSRTPGAIQARFGGFCWIQLGLIWLGWAGLVSPTK